MKKLFLFLIAAAPLFGQTLHSPLNRLSIFLSYNVNNTVKLSNSGITTILKAEGAPVLGAEFYLTKNTKGSSTGFGGEYQFSGNVTGLHGHYNNIPLYLFYDICLSDSVSAIPRLSLKLGYSFLKVWNNFPASGATSKAVYIMDLVYPVS